MRVMLESFRICESSRASLEKREAEIVIIEEGPGNKGRKCYYGPEAIESAGPVFRGCQVYADHPSNSEQTDLPERSVRDLIGRIKETWVDVNPSNGKKQLRGVLKIYEGKDFDWAVSLIKESVQAQKEGYPPVAQVSIHADGDIEPRMVEGDRYNYVNRIKSAVSVDVVTKGGIRNSGFVNFMESALGGRMKKKPNEQADARFRGIQHKLAESITNDEAEFLENYLRENSEGAEDIDETGDEEVSGEIFEDPETGERFASTGELDEEGNLLCLNENGETVAIPQEELSDEPEMEFDDFNDEADIEEPDAGDEPGMEFDGADDEVPVSEVAHRFPHLAHEIDQEEAGTMESDRDYDLVAVKFENKLLKSRIVADKKLRESGLPSGVVSIAELVGKSPDEMDLIIESRARMLETVSGMVQGSIRSLNAASLRENGDGRGAGVGVRILRNSVNGGI